jgi:hypothetical protein
MISDFSLECMSMTEQARIAAKSGDYITAAKWGERLLGYYQAATFLGATAADRETAFEGARKVWELCAGLK